MHVCMYEFPDEDKQEILESKFSVTFFGAVSNELFLLLKF